MAKRKKTNAAAKTLAVDAANIADGGNCRDVVVLDVRGISPVADYFVIVTGTSGRQMRSVADDIEAHGKEIGQRVWQVAGVENADWIVMDFVDVVVHLFDESHRQYYDLELIWGEAPRVPWRRRKPRTKPAAPAKE